MKQIGVLFFFMMASAFGQIKVAILGSPAQGAAANADVQAKLYATGRFSVVDIYDVAVTTPPLATLQQYSSVLVYSDEDYADSANLGSILQSYVDAGFGVVTALFTETADIAFDGGFATSDYWVFEPAIQTSGQELTLGSINVPDSPLLAGVSRLDGGFSSYIATGGLNTYAIDVADWSNGSPLVAYRNIGQGMVVGLNLYPPSSSVRSDFWHADTDGGTLMANALAFAGSRSLPSDPGSAKDPDEEAHLGALALEQAQDGSRPPPPLPHH